MPAPNLVSVRPAFLSSPMLVAIPAAIGLFAALSWVLEGPGLGQGLGRVHLLVELAIVAALAGAWTTRGRLGQVLSALTRVDPFALPHVLWFGLLYFALRAPLIFSGSYGKQCCEMFLSNI